MCRSLLIPRVQIEIAGFGIGIWDWDLGFGMGWDWGFEIRMGKGFGIWEGMEGDFQRAASIIQITVFIRIEALPR